MPTIPLATIARRNGIRRAAVTLRPIITTQAQANELATIIMPIVNHWQAAQADILRGYVLPIQDGSSALTTDNASDMQSAIERAAAEALRLVVLITPRLRDWAVKVERWHRGKWADSVKAGTTVDLSSILTAIPVQETLDAFIARNVALVRDISAQAQSRIADIVFRNYQQRTPIATVAKEVSEAVGMSRTRARRVASDQTVKIAAALDRERRAEAGIDRYKWRHSGKAHPREEHRARDGHIFENGTPAGDEPGSAPFCGCRAQAYLAILDDVE